MELGEKMIRVFVGFDSRETVAYHVLSHSILKRASEPVSVAPVALSQLERVFSRPRDPKQSTDFSFSRFLVPYLAGFDGWAVFMDCDMLCRSDIAGLLRARDDRFAVQVVKHVYAPKDDIKFLNAEQTKYARKNWSSVMLFNCGKCRTLTPDYVANASGLDLHQFKWLADDGLVGDIDRKWNHLVGEYEKSPDAALVHFTVGGPYFHEYRNCDYSEEWFAEREDMLRCDQRVPGPVA
jgi:hypothetical protein